MGVQAFGYVMLLGFMFGSVTVVSRLMVNQIAPLAYISSRFVLAGLAFFIINTFGIRGRSWPRDKRLWLLSILYGVFGDVVQISLFILSLQYLSAGLAAILNTFFPVLSVILAHFLLPNEQINRKTGIGVALALTGALLIVGLGETGLEAAEGNRLTGYLMIFGAGLLFSLSAVFARKYMVAYNTFDTISIRMISAAAASALLAVLFSSVDFSGLTSTGGVLILYAGAIYFFGFLLNFYVLQRYNVTTYSLVFYVVPVVTSILGLIFLSEQITVGMISGMILIMGGVSVINFTKQKASASEAG